MNGIRTAIAAALAGGAGACTPAAPVAIGTRALPEATVGVPYEVVLVAEGGTPPLRWQVDPPLPPGLRLTAGGRIEGVPEAVGSHPLAIRVLDGAGASDTAFVRLEVAFGCGATYEGRLFERGVLGYGDPRVDFRAERGFAAREIPLPHPSVSSLRGRATESTALFLGRPGASLDRLDAADVDFVGTSFELPPWELEEYRSLGAPIVVVVAAWQAGPWSLTTACEDGSHLLAQAYPAVQEGRAFYQPFELYRAPGAKPPFSTVTIEATSLPDFVEVSKPAVALRGVAERFGYWPFDLRVTEPDGRSRRLESGLAVHRTLPLACNTSAVRVLVQPPDPDRGRLPSALYPKTFAALETPLSSEISAMFLLVDGPDAGTVRAGFMDPGTRPSDLSARIQGNGAQVVQIDSTSWPSLREARARGGTVTSLLFGATEPVDADVSLICSRASRVDWGALPVLPDGPAAWTVPVSGGGPPYELVGRNLPEGVTLSSEGVLSYDGSLPPGDVYPDVAIDVFSATPGQSGQARYTLYVGEQAACGGRPRIGCDEPRAVSGVVSSQGDFEVCIASKAVSQGAQVLVNVVGDADVQLFSPVGQWRQDVRPQAPSPIRLAQLDLLPQTRGLGAPIVLRLEGADPGAPVDAEVFSCAY